MDVYDIGSNIVHITDRVLLPIETEALEVIQEASRRTRTDEPQTRDNTMLDDDTRDILVPSGSKRAEVGRSRAQTGFEIV